MCAHMQNVTSFMGGMRGGDPRNATRAGAMMTRIPQKLFQKSASGTFNWAVVTDVGPLMAPKHIQFRAGSTCSNAQDCSGKQSQVLIFSPGLVAICVHMRGSCRVCVATCVHMRWSCRLCVATCVHMRWSCRLCVS